MARPMIIRPILLSALALVASGCMPQVDRGDRSEELIVAKAFGPVSLDPGFSTTANETPIQAQLYEQLVAIDPASADAQVVGELAERWVVADDGLSIRFNLRAGGRFSDGSLIDADAVKFSFERVKRIGRGPSGFLEWLDRVEVVDPLTVKLVLKRPYAAALQMLAQPSASVVSPASVRAHDVGDDGTAWLSENSAGSGPYVLGDYRANDYVTMVARPRGGRPQPGFRTIRFRALPDEGVRRLLLERGDVDMTDIVPAALVGRYAAIEGVDVRTSPGGVSQSFLMLNTRSGPLTDVRIRQAVAAAIDYRALRGQVLKGNATQLSGYLTPGSPGFAADEPPPRRDLARAKALLREAGYDGRPLVLLISQLGPVAEFVQSNLAEAGIRVRLERRSGGAIQALQAAGDFDLIYTGWSLDVPDAAPFLEALFTTRGIASGANGSGLSDPDIDRLVEAALVESDPTVRARLLRAADVRLRALRPVVMLFSAKPVAAYRSDLQGVALNPYAPANFDFAAISRVPTRPKP